MAIYRICGFRNMSSGRAWTLFESRKNSKPRFAKCLARSVAQNSQRPPVHAVLGSNGCTLPDTWNEAISDFLHESLIAKQFSLQHAILEEGSKNHQGGRYNCGD
jgi:hypothetical protein